MPDPTLSQAIREAYASAPADVVVHPTLEIRHPSFTMPIRVVLDNQDLVATLEATAPEDAGQQVTFVAYSFRFTKPEVNPSGMPRMTIEIDNVSREILVQIEAAVNQPDPVTVIYREYISSDLSGPQNDPPLKLTITGIRADVFRIQATAEFADFVNRKFPGRIYSADQFPGLAS